MDRPAMFWRGESSGENPSVRCLLCPHECLIPQNSPGICGVRRNTNGRLLAESYGKVTSIALDPIEKKPLRLFEPGKMVLSIGSYGCNLRCLFCQNHSISMPEPSIGPPRIRRITPAELLALAQESVSHGNIGAAFTYNEPLIGCEFVYDSARLLKSAGLKAVLVTNGYIREEPLETLLPYIDAMNIDLKAFTSGFYRNIGGSLEPVKAAIKCASSSCHIEITTLVIPGENNGDIESIASWISEIDPAIPLHLSRFFPRHQYSTGHQPTPRETILELAETARKYLKHVYAGNIG